jgi:hypothetical protein
VKRPTARRKIRDRPGIVPSDDTHVTTRDSRIFHAADVPNLRLQSGSSLRQGEVGDEVLAVSLNSAISDYVIFYTLARRRNPTDKTNLWFERVEADATKLLNTLGLSYRDWERDGLINARVLQLPAFKHLRQGMRQMAPFRRGVPKEIRETFGGRLFFDALRQAEERANLEGSILDPSAALRVEGQTAARALLQLAPAVLVLVAGSARAARAVPRQGPQGGGRRPDEARENLFRKLLDVYRDVFGALPVTRNKLANRSLDEPSVRWVRRVLAVAACRLQRMEYPQTVDAADRLGKLSRLSEARLGDFLEVARAKANRRLREN